MSEEQTDISDREQHILDVTVDLIIRQGYDKTTMSDIAKSAGVSRGVVYLHFDSKDNLFETLLYREVRLYMGDWLNYIREDANSGTMGGVYRAVLYAINKRPLMQSIMRRDQKLFGSYLRSPNNMFANIQHSSIWPDTLRAMQEAGAVRADIDVHVMSYIIECISYGMVTLGEMKDPDDIPPFDALMETLAESIDKLLTPEDGGNREAGKAIIQQLAESLLTKFNPPQPDT